MKFIAVDSGKYATKAITIKADGTEKILVFRTKMEETIKKEAQGKSYIVTFRGKKYIIGEQAETNSAKSSKAEELHKICTYTALHQLVNSGEELVVALGCPLATYENPESREAYRRYMFPEKQIDVQVKLYAERCNFDCKSLNGMSCPALAMLVKFQNYFVNHINITNNSCPF